MTFAGLSLFLLTSFTPVDRAEALIGKLSGIPAVEIEHTVFESPWEFIADKRGYRPIWDDLPPTPSRIEHHPILVSLVKMGAEAIPALCRHLSAKEPTRYTFKGEELFVTDHYDRYALREHRKWSLLPERPTRMKYLTMGDLCFFILGQIVNREFMGGRHAALNAPSASPSLVKKAREEWGSCTPSQLLWSLTRDIVRPDIDRRDQGAVRRLRLYFPTKLEGAAIRRLRTPFLNANAEDAFFFIEDGIRDPSKIAPIQVVDLLTALSDVNSKLIDDQCAEMLTSLTVLKTKDQLTDFAAEALMERLEKRKELHGACLAYIDRRIREVGDVKLLPKKLVAIYGRLTS